MCDVFHWRVTPPPPCTRRAETCRLTVVQEDGGCADGIVIQLFATLLVLTNEVLLGISEDRCLV